MDLAASAETVAAAIREMLVSVRPQLSDAVQVTRQSRKTNNAVEPHLLAALSDASSVMFLDVETTGLSRHYDELTLVGWLLNGIYHVHVMGDNDEPLRSSLRAASALVTFNGTLFDIPFLAKSFAHLSLPKTHADLRFLARRVDLTGGQKAIEKQLGVKVREGVEDLDGAQAVLLWHRYLRGDVNRFAVSLTITGPTSSLCGTYSTWSLKGWLLALISGSQTLGSRY